MVETLRSIPYGIYVLTARRGAEVEAVVVSWVSQVSYSPPLLMVALRRNRKALPVIRESRRFSLSLLKKEQRNLVTRLKLRPGEPFPSDIFGGLDSGECPLVKDCLASWQCRLISLVEPGDHVLCIGEVQSASGNEGTALTTMDYGKTYIGEF